MEGYKWYFGQAGDPFEGMLINVWSAPNYAYMSKNTASFLMLRYPGRPSAELRTFRERPERIQTAMVDLQRYFA
jgi:hypothetical protein